MDKTILTTVKDINKACQSGKVYYDWSATGSHRSRVYKARSMNGALQVQTTVREDIGPKPGRNHWRKIKPYQKVYLEDGKCCNDKVE